jgi:hypothetical protein
MHNALLGLLALAGAAQAHMSLFYPAPLGGAPSINKQSTTLDPEFNYPLGCCGSDGGPTKPNPGICRGHLDKFDIEDASVTWESGQDAYFQLTSFSYDPNAPGGTHYGGSCQVGFSTDKGATWKVAASYHGACPKHTEDGTPEGQTFDFKVPTGMPEGDVLFVWSWLNREHESFISCAKVKITAGSSNTKPSQSVTQTQTSSRLSSTYPTSPAQSSPQSKQPDDAGNSAPTAVISSVATIPHSSATSIYSRPRSTATSSSASAAPTEPASNNDDSDDEGDDNSDNHWWSQRPHKEVKAGTRKYNVNGWNCECRREPLNSRCYCGSEDTSTEQRAAIEKKALRMHRRTLYKRTDACDWATAPAMEVSYYTEDAKCAPNAKLRMPESDDFELSWNVNCGVVEGDGEYKLREMDCGMYGT